MDESLYDLVVDRTIDHTSQHEQKTLSGTEGADGPVAFRTEIAFMHRWCKFNEKLVIDRHGGTAHVYSGFERLSRVKGVAKRYRQLSERAASLTLFGVPDWKVPFAARCVPVTEGPLLTEWFVLVLARDYRALIVARDLKSIDLPSHLRVFHGVATHDEQVIRAAVDLLERYRSRLAA